MPVVAEQELPGSLRGEVGREERAARRGEAEEAVRAGQADHLKDRGHAEDVDAKAIKESGPASVSTQSIVYNYVGLRRFINNLPKKNNN